MNLNTLLEKIKKNPENVEFDEVIQTIENIYTYSPTRFINGIGSTSVTNEAGQNEGSCKIFAFGQINKLDEKQTLACFGKYYRNDVLEHPENEDHANIRRFMEHGWSGLQFEKLALLEKTY